MTDPGLIVLFLAFVALSFVHWRFTMTMVEWQKTQDRFIATLANDLLGIMEREVDGKDAELAKIRAQFKQRSQTGSSRLKVTKDEANKIN